MTQDGVLLTRLIGHGCPCEVHGVESDDRGLEEARARLMFLFQNRRASQGQKGKFYLEMDSFTPLPQMNNY